MLSYFEVIQVYFTHMTGRVAIFSGRDMALLESWRGQGASAASVCRGVRDAVLHMEGGDRPPRDLYNCRAFIEPYVERARHRRLGMHPEEEDMPKPPPSLIHARKQLIAHAFSTLRKADPEVTDERIRAVYREVWHGIKDIEQSAMPEEYYAALLDMEAYMAERVFEVLDERTRARIDAQIVEESQGMARRMSREAWIIHRAARRRRILMRDHGLISLIGED